MSRDNKKARKACLKAHAYSAPDPGTGYRMAIWMDCKLCREPFLVAQTRWQADHEIPHWYKPSDDPADVWPVHYTCHRAKTNRDLGDIAKSKRILERRFGVKPATMPGSRNTRYQVKMDGSVIDRRTGEVLKQGRWNRGRQ